MRVSPGFRMERRLSGTVPQMRHGPLLMSGSPRCPFQRHEAVFRPLGFARFGCRAVQCRQPVCNELRHADDCRRETMCWRMNRIAGSQSAISGARAVRSPVRAQVSVGTAGRVFAGRYPNSCRTRERRRLSSARLQDVDFRRWVGDIREHRPHGSGQNPGSTRGCESDSVVSGAEMSAG